MEGKGLQAGAASGLQRGWSVPPHVPSATEAVWQSVFKSAIELLCPGEYRVMLCLTLKH